MDDVFDINKTITALDILQTNGFSVLYFGTKDGQLGMIGKIDINDCSIHKDCESCMNSFDSSCGWDYDENRNDKELGHIEESEMAFSEINPVAELNSNSSIINHRPVNIEYERLGHRPLTNPYNHLQHLADDNQIRDIKNIGNRTVSPSDYMNLKL
ncbi:PLXNB [Mytilus edulis]|uniref:PLXNB n=1 Tax=Mytilus edulis TaxID=6550 RepID=A0A8S3R990_MYTED|nr:PLXNB [Mytilus edulis]